MKALPESSTGDLSQYYPCRACGMKFDSFGDMQRHMLVEHIQKGDIPSDEESQKKREWFSKRYACHDINDLYYLHELYESL